MSRVLYGTHCASCHGLSGRGDGPLADVMRRRPSDLTEIRRRYRGFPTDLMIRIVDGRHPVRGHGSLEMPVWGDVFRTGGVPNEVAIRERIVALVQYLEGIRRGTPTDTSARRHSAGASAQFTLAPRRCAGIRCASNHGMRFVLAAILVAHGIAHLVGLVVSWRLAVFAEMPYKTTVLAGRIDAGDMGIRVIGVGRLPVGGGRGVRHLAWAVVLLTRAGVFLNGRRVRRAAPHATGVTSHQAEKRGKITVRRGSFARENAAGVKARGLKGNCHARSARNLQPDP